MATKKSTTNRGPSSAPWNKSMPAKQFDFMREILSAPSPIGLEGAMSYGVLKPAFEKLKHKNWGIHQFKGNASIILDTDPGDEEKVSVMVIGHADKIRMSSGATMVSDHVFGDEGADAFFRWFGDSDGRSVDSLVSLYLSALF